MRTIKARLAITVIAAVVSAVTIASLASAWRDSSRRLSTKTRELAAIAATLATAVSPAVVKADRQEVARLLAAIGRIPGLTYSRITDAQGTIIIPVSLVTAQ